MKERVGWRMCWVLPLLSNAFCVRTAEASIGVSSSRSAWLSAGASLASDSGYREQDATQSASFLDSSLEAIDAIPEYRRELGLEGVYARSAVNNPLPISNLRGNRKSAVATGLGAALALIFFLFLIKAGGQRRAGQREDGLGKEDSRRSFDAREERITSTREEKTAEKPTPAGPRGDPEQRLEELRKLLPAASRLASAVGSEEAQILLTNMRENVQQADQLEDKPMENLEPNERLDRALEALRSLYRTATVHAEVLAKNGGESHTFSLLDTKEEAVALLAAVEKDMESEGVLPFVEYLNLLDSCISNMCRQFNKARGEISAEPKFVDERDGELLMSLTNKVEWLRDLANKKEHALNTAFKVEKGMLYTIKAHLFGVREVSLLHLESELGIAKALAAAAGGDNDTKSGKNAQDYLAAQHSILLSSLSEKLELAETVLGKLRAILGSGHPHTTLGDILSASRRAEELDAQASSLLVKCLTLAMNHPHSAENFQSGIFSMLKDVALKAHWRAVSEKAGLRVALREIQSSNEVSPEASPEVQPSPTPHLNNILVTNLVESAKDISGKAEKYYCDTKALVEALHSQRETKHMVSQVQKATATVSPMVKLSTESYMLMLDSCLLKVLDMDVAFSMKVAERASSSRSALSHLEQRLLEDLEGSFDAAKKATKEAKTIRGAVEAAAIMREKAEAMESLVKQRTGLPHSR